MFSSSSVQTGHLVSRTNLDTTPPFSTLSGPTQQRVRITLSYFCFFVCLITAAFIHNHSHCLFCCFFCFLRKKLNRKPVSVWQTSTSGNSSVTSSCAHSLETPAVLRPWRENPFAEGPIAHGRVSSECQQREPWTQMLLKALFTTVKS